jgi:hypothetical protein
VTMHGSVLLIERDEDLRDPPRPTEETAGQPPFDHPDFPAWFEREQGAGDAGPLS